MGERNRLSEIFTKLLFYQTVRRGGEMWEDVGVLVSETFMPKIFIIFSHWPK